MQSEAGGVLRLLASFGGGAAPAGAVKTVLGALGRIGAATARALAFPADPAASAAETLAGVVDRLASLLTALDSLADDAGRVVLIEARISSDPPSLRQLLLSLRTSQGVQDRFSVAGFALGVEANWNAGLLIDFVSRPGAYLIVTPAAGAQAAFATISTDLWLEKGGTAEAMRDANPKTGDRGQSDPADPSTPPLLSAKASATLSDPRLIVVGLWGGQMRVLQRVKSTPSNILLSGGALTLSTYDGPLEFAPLDAELGVEASFPKDRLLPLLGMGEPGVEGAGGDFLDRLKNSLSQFVWVKNWTPGKTPGRQIPLDVVLGVKAAGVESEVKLTISLNLDNWRVKVDASTKIRIKSKRVEQRALGLDWVLEQADEDDRVSNAEVEMFDLIFKDDGETELLLNTGEHGGRMQIRFADLSSDGRGLVLNVTDFRVSRAGLDLAASPVDQPVVLNGIGTPFQFIAGNFVIKGGKLIQASIGGRGSLPNDLIGNVDCSVLLNFQQAADSGAIVLQSGHVDFDKRGQPIVCHATCFTLTLENLEIGFVSDGGYHFYFMLTGSIQFTPREGEFENGLLQFLKDVRIDLDRAPLCRDPRVLVQHLSFQKALNPKKTFPLFNLFEFELRGFGFHGSSPKFGGDPAINLSGQITFSLGEAKDESIEFHGLWMAGPAKGQSLPRIRLDGLGVNIGFGGAAIIRGSVLAVDPQTPTLANEQIAPPGYDAYGFLGDGTVSLSGFASFSASFGFLEVARKDRPQERRKAFFLYLERDKIAVEIPLVIWTFYMREVGFGFGYRYTLAGIREAEDATSVAAIVKALDDVSKRQGDLSRFAAWSADPEGDKVTLALRGAFQCFEPPDEEYDDDQEREWEEPFFFDIVVALRSDLTFLMSTRGWLATNYHDFLTDGTGEKIRTHPGLRGYMYISAPRSELLMRAIGDHTGYVGDRFEDIAALKDALHSIDWSATLYINPTVFHYELGWPDQLVARLRDDDKMRVIVRGGMIFRATGDGILWGFNIEADAVMHFGGSVGGGTIGLAVEAGLTAKFIARLIAYLARNLNGTLIYGLISLDANVSFSVRAWMHVDLGFTSFDINISFSFQI